MATDGDDGHRQLSNGVSTHLIRLQSKDHEEILNVIDQLRSEGIGKYVNLPQLIVCGDQSSGKSSVLEAISGLGFPRRDNVCTRFATELILRRAPESGVTASIYPDDERSLVEKERLRGFRSPTLALNQFEDIVKSAEDLIGVSRDGLLFSKDVLRVEVSGPTQPHLTLVDLPGLYHASDASQNDEGVEFVESLVLSYMENRRSVMLAVISAKSDIALQKVTAFTRRVDPEGDRTMGIITKPDTLPSTSDMEQSFYNLARNKRMPFRLGWHDLKNRTFEERDFSLTQRHESEADFLAQGIWSSLPRSCVGVSSLRPRLSTVLKDHILSQMSGFIEETQSSLKDAESSVQKLGHARQTISEQRRYLLHSSERFAALVSAAVNGIYSDPFFGDAIDDDGYEKRLRAVMQNRLSDFSDTMRERGEHRRFVEDDHDVEDGDVCMTRSDFVEEVRKRMRRSRGRELPGMFNPLIVGDLFFLHARPWQKIVDEYTESMLEDVRNATFLILHEVLDDRSIEGLLKHVVNPRLSGLEDSLREKTAELLKPQQMGHPITYNHYFVETIQAAREQHLRDAITEKLKVFFGNSYPESPSVPTRISFSMTTLIEALGSQNDPDMEKFACSEAIDYMLAYYKVARKKFVDDFGNLAVEKCLLEPLLTIYCPRTVDTIADNIVDDIASEDEDTRAERDRLNEKLAVLKRSLDRLHQLDLHSLAAKRASSKTHHDRDDGEREKTHVTHNEGSSPARRVDPLHNFFDLTEISNEDEPKETLEVDVRKSHSAVDDWEVPSQIKKKKKKQYLGVRRYKARYEGKVRFSV